MRIILSSFLLLLCLSGLYAQDSYQIKVEIDNYEGDTIILGYYLGENQYVRDTAVRQKNKFVFEDDEALPTGIYLVIVPPKNEIIQLLIDDDQELSISARYDDGLKDIEFKGSDENEVYYSYVNYIQDKKLKSAEIYSLMDSLEETSDEYQDYVSQVKEIDNLVQSHMDNIKSEHPDSYTSLILRSNEEIKIPDYEGSDKEVQLKRFHFFKKEYIKNMFLEDERMFRSPHLFERIEYYTDKLTMRSPDSIAQSVDKILQPLEKNEDAFQYYLVHFLNKYAKSKVVGHDGVYVHIAENYYAKGKAPWTKAEQLAKILKNSENLAPTLIGKIAPNITLQDRENNNVSLHDIESDYTIIYFWNPDCGHCKKSTPKLIDFYKENKDKGFKVIAVCGKTGKDYDSCWSYIDEKEDMDMLYNLGDKFYRSKFKSVFYVKTTPKLFVLDKDKKILSKGIGVEQLPELMKYLTEEEAID